MKSDKKASGKAGQRAQAKELLRLNLGKLSLKSPIVIASGTFGYGDEYLHVRGFSFDDIGAIALKGVTIRPRAGNPAPRIVETTGGMLNSIGLSNIGVNALIEEKLPMLQDLGTHIILNVGGDRPEDLIDAAKALSYYQNYFSAIEVNVSCPNLDGTPIGQNTGTTARVVTSIRKLYRIPLIVKLVPNIASIVEVAGVCERAGADILTIANTFPGMAIDVFKRRPILGNNTGGLSGPAIKPLALLLVHRVYRAVSIPIIASGGITCARDAMEFIIAGASAISIGTALFYDANVCKRITEGLVDFLNEDAKMNGLEQPRPLKDYVGTLVLNG
ncbi:MAG: dihydroorotate dehydrogenase [Candidatus Coatesbacteria bacterium]|nr:dihydroorotate dehydrogenase [Candidatus Coatesbacteria bacterium]